MVPPISAKVSASVLCPKINTGSPSLHSISEIFTNHHVHTYISDDRGLLSCYTDIGLFISVHSPDTIRMTHGNSSRFHIVRSFKSPIITYALTGFNHMDLRNYTFQTSNRLEVFAEFRIIAKSV